ncbi:MAG: hypothetical protein DHS20C15_24570 [Planctomycetota bacterium]|nr:MAG: hypothetical protein DHS20C15_24570 [Planctomycetota bacterium]
MSIMFRDTCRTIRDKLPLHVGRDLEPKLEKQVDEHLATCLSCFREYRALAESRAILGVVAEERLPEGILDGFTEEVMARIAVGEEGPAAELPRAARRAPLRLIPALSAAAALLLVALAAQLYFEGGQTVANPDIGGLLQQHDAGSNASDAGVSSRPQNLQPMQPMLSGTRNPNGRRFVFPGPRIVSQPEPGQAAEPPNTLEMQMNEALKACGVDAHVELGELQTTITVESLPRGR